MDQLDSAVAPLGAIRVGEWEPWFAWRPVRLYMSGRHAWLRLVYRRCVVKARVEYCDYTDEPAAFPS